MEDYWSEVKNIEEDGERAHEDLLERGSMDGLYQPGLYSFGHATEKP